MPAIRKFAVTNFPCGPAPAAGAGGPGKPADASPGHGGPAPL